MEQQEVFGNAVWVGKEEKNFYVLRGRFKVNGVKRAILRVLGLGFFHCYINGKRVGDDLFLPLNSEYEPRIGSPKKEEFSGFHTYVPEYDITELLQDGENVIAIHFGGGWYAVGGWYSNGYGFNFVKAIWRIFGEDNGGNFDFVSSVKDKIGESFITEYKFDYKPKETHNYTLYSPLSIEENFDDGEWDNARAVEPLESDFLFTDCPADKVAEVISPKLISQTENFCVYDCGKNTTGYPVLKLKANVGEKVVVCFSEEIKENGILNEKFAHNQKFTIISDGEERIVRPLFLWYGFRYFSVQGKAETLNVEVVYSDLEQVSDFNSDNELLNWLYRAYVNSQITNMHGGVPSDCPHLEKRGYTGDGQVTCRAAMRTFNCQSFYKKWIRDIADGQDKLTGKIQNAAPFVHSSAGGPGGWGSAIIEVPYQYYCEYGDENILKEYYPYMKKYLDYMASRSVSGLVEGIENGDEYEFLGEWATPEENILSKSFVNTYFYIKSLEKAIEISKIIGKGEEAAIFKTRISIKRSAVKSAYEDFLTGSYFNDKQAADAFALDMGIGDERTYNRLVKYYEEKQELDTGIFGLDVLTRVLFERGNASLAIKLLCAKGEHSFDEMKKIGATTLWEYMPNSVSERSLNHPMFGSVVAYFYEYLLGIRGDAGYKAITISPVFVKEITKLSGKRVFGSDVVSVSYTRQDDNAELIINVPDNRLVRFAYGGKIMTLKSGINELTIHDLKIQ